MADGRMFILNHGEALDAEPCASRSAPPQESMLVYVHVRRDLVEANAPLEAILADVNDKIDRHGGIVLSSRQFLRHHVQAEWDINKHFDDYNSAPEDHRRFEWGDEQRVYFGGLWGLEAPFQYTGQPAYNQFAISARVPAPYLEPSEHILALLQTSPAEVALECPCHWTQIVYTSAQRVLCMGCGQLLCVLADTLPGSFRSRISRSEWLNAFDADGELIDDTIDVETVDFRAVEKMKMIWQTDVWDEVTARIKFYATASDEEIERFHRTCLPTPAGLLAAGFVEKPTPPSVSDQIGRRDYGVDLAENAAQSVNAAANAYMRGKTAPGALRDSVLSAFHAVELLLKLKLAELDQDALTKKPNNPTVLRLLSEAGVKIGTDELDTIEKLRQLRNKFQHASASIGYRSTRTLLRQSFLFLDRFLAEELDVWIGAVCDAEGWHGLLAIDAIRSRAEAVVAQAIADLRGDTAVSIKNCPICTTESLIMSREGLFCLYCRSEPFQEPIIFDEEEPAN